MKVIDDGPGDLSDQAINWIGATEVVQLQIIDINLSGSLEHAEKLATNCDLNESFAAKFKDLEATEPVQDGPSSELAAAQQELEELEEELQIKKRQHAKLERRLDKCKSEPETTGQSDIAELRLEKDMLLDQVKNRSSVKSSPESELRAIEYQQKRFPSSQNGSIRVDTLCQSRHRNPGVNRMRRIPYCPQIAENRFFSFCRSHIEHDHSGVVANCDHTSEWVHWVRPCIGIAMRWVTLWKSLLTFLLHYAPGA